MINLDIRIIFYYKEPVLLKFRKFTYIFNISINNYKKNTIIIIILIILLDTLNNNYYFFDFVHYFLNLNLLFLVNGVM